MNTRKVKEIVKFDIEKSIQNKWFVILNVIIFISILAVTNWQNISKFLEDHNINVLSTEEAKIQVIDSENLIYDDMVEKYKDYENIKFEKVEKNEYSKENLPEDEVVLVEVNRDENEIIIAKIISKEGISNEIYNLIYDELKEIRSELFAEKNNIAVEDLNILNEEPSIERELLGVDAENSDTKQGIKMVSIILVYMVLIFVLSRIASEIAQEKVSKSIEYVLTSVSEKEYLIAKVLGATITILIQALYTFVYYLIGNMISTLFVANSVSGSIGVMFKNVDTSIVSYVLVMTAYLIFTVFLTTLIQAALSAKTTSVAEAGNTTMILMSVIIALYFVSIAVITPYTTVSPLMYILSCLPIVSTFFVPAMMIIGQATTFQIIISFVLLIATVPLIFNVCAKHFKNGILDYTSSNKNKKGIFKVKQKQELSLREKQEYDLRVTKAKKFAFTIGLALIIFILLEAILSFVLGITLNSILKDKLDSNTITVLESGIISIIAMGLTAGFIKLYSDVKSEKNNLTKKNIFNCIFIGIGLIGLLQIILPYFYKDLGLDPNIMEKFNIMPGSGILDKIIYFITLAIIPAIFEELLFRKAILNYCKKFGNLFAIVFSAILFGLIHMNISQGLFAFIIGIILGIIAIKTSSIKITIFLHFLNNAFVTLQVLLGENSVAFGIINNIVLALVVFGIIIAIRNIPNLKKLNKDEFKLNKDCKFLLRNYTFIISMVLLIIMFVTTENIIRL